MVVFYWFICFVLSVFWNVSGEVVFVGGALMFLSIPKSATKVLLFLRKCKRIVILFEFWWWGEDFRERECRMDCRRKG